jgi:hypothetical protein
MTWRERAACKGKTHLFFVERGNNALEAKAICKTCPVKKPCLEAGHGQIGVWGGMVERQRRKLPRAS